MSKPSMGHPTITKPTGMADALALLLGVPAVETKRNAVTMNVSKRTAQSVFG